MTFNRFLDAAYALLHDGHASLDSLPAATERMTQWALPVKEPEVPSTNDQAIAALKARMAGVQGKPKMA